MADIADKLEIRAALIAFACSTVPKELLWRWGDFEWKRGLRVGSFENGGTDIGFLDPKDKKALIKLSNIRPLGQLKNERVQMIPVGPEKTVDGVVLISKNFDGVNDLPVHYNAGFGKSKGQSEAFAFGFTQSLETTFKFSQGSGDFAKSEQEIKLGFEARQDQTNESHSGSTEQRDAGTDPVCPPAFDIQTWQTRTTQPRKTRLTGIGDVEHNIKIGKHWEGNWNGHRGEGGKKWPRWGSWDTFEDFLRVIKGDGRRDFSFASHFKNNPAPGWLIEKLEEPLDFPFEHESQVFDGATKIETHQKTLRGPNPVILELLK